MALRVARLHGSERDSLILWSTTTAGAAPPTNANASSVVLRIESGTGQHDDWHV